MSECDWWNMYQTDNIVGQHLRKHFPLKKSLRKEGLLQKIKSVSLFCYVQCVLEIPEMLRETFANFLPIFKTIIIGEDENGLFMKHFAEKDALLTQPRRLLISSSLLEDVRIITPLLLFHLHLGPVCKKNLSLCGIYSNEALQWFR